MCFERASETSVYPAAKGGARGRDGSSTTLVILRCRRWRISPEEPSKARPIGAPGRKETQEPATETEGRGESHPATVRDACATVQRREGAFGMRVECKGRGLWEKEGDAYREGSAEVGP